MRFAVYGRLLRDTRRAIAEGTGIELPLQQKSGLRFWMRNLSRLAYKLSCICQVLQRRAYATRGFPLPSFRSFGRSNIRILH